MNNIADQLQGTNWLDFWRGKISGGGIWGVQVWLINACVLYWTAHIIIWKTAKGWYCQFQEEIIKAWMEKEKSVSEGQKKRKLSDNQVSSYRSSSSESMKILGRTWTSVASVQSECTVLQRGRKASDKSLDLTSGELNIHMNAVFHYPIPPGKSKFPPCNPCLQDGTSRKNWVQGASISKCDKCYVSKITWI